jgi:uncharacterized C2H2 Zn-finger protein
MSYYKCSICDYNSSNRANVERHITKLNKCGTDPEIIEIKEKIKCTHCGNEFTYHKNLIRHMNTSCKKIVNELIRLSEENKKLQEKLEKESKESKASTVNTTNNITNNNNTTINNTINVIVVNSYKDPNLDHLTEKDYIRAIKKIVMSIPEIIRQIHFNENAPENHNVCITNFKGKFARVFDGKEWRTVDEEKVIDTLINDNEYLLEQYAEDNPELQVYIDKYKRIKEANKGSLEKETKKEIRTLLYDKRNMVIKMIN